MQYKPIQIYGAGVVEQARLGGQVTAPVLLESTTARLTPWTASAEEIAGNASCVLERMCRIRAPFEKVQDASFVKIGDSDTEYEVFQLVDHGVRGCTLRIRGSK